MLSASLLIVTSPVQAQDDPFGADWPAGEGRELTGAWCGGCHSLDLVKQQGLDRQGWDHMLQWMTEKQNMPPLQGEMLDTVLTYLSTNFGIGSAEAADEGVTEDLSVPLSPTQGIQRPLLEIRPKNAD